MLFEITWYLFLLTRIRSVVVEIEGILPKIKRTLMHPTLSQLHLCTNVIILRGNVGSTDLTPDVTCQGKSV